ncbi:PREDICTED: uncharacterized protein LOC109220481 [Nicotiana attenuata]|uniref:uncharacterized protein LOC109220481 n=1 Tax=Nicotiana attenuata TaxID=49451 RepID=UPI000904D5D0|nr:PREDICTED: uncharacterized protein LOC109220481 [Nicotiana attenuata]
MNVEVCSDIKVVKYLYKYICKGHDKIAVYVHDNDTNKEIDEIKEYQSTRWVSPPEAAWRLFGFSISEMYPSVYHLQLHLNGQQLVSFKDKTWTLRQQRGAVGRIVTCHPTEGERYYLRLLLLNVRGPKSYADLQTINGERYNTFRESAEKRGLLHCDNSLIDCMAEAASYQMPYSLRSLFVTLLVYCNPANPKEIWKQFKESMSEDYKVLPNVERKDIQYQVLNQINDILHSMGHNINEYELIPEKVQLSILEKEAKEVFFERTISVSEEDILLQKKLNTKQLKAYNVVIDRVFSKKPGAFFIDGPGGTEKTFLYRALLATIRSKGYIALATATSGVAASILPGGRTAHSRFKIPIDIDENFSCNISKQSSTASLIRDA